MRDLVDKQAVEDVCGHVSDARLSMGGGGLLGSPAERFEADYDHLVGTEIDGRLDRAVEPRPTVGVMTARGAWGCDLDCRERDRNRCRGADVLAAQASLDIPDLVARVAWNLAIGRDEADRLTGGEHRGDHAHGIRVTRPHVVLEAPPVDPAIEASRQRGGVEHTREPDAGQPKRMTNQSQHHANATDPDEGREHILLAQTFPQCHGLLDLLVCGKVGERRERHRVDRADAGPAPDRHALAACLQRRQKRGEGPDFVGAASSPAGRTTATDTRSVAADSFERCEVPAERRVVARLAGRPSQPNGNG